MQETTFTLINQADGSCVFKNTHQWLDAFSALASTQKIDKENFFDLVLRHIELSHLETKLGYKFKNKKILIHSLLQSTFTYEVKVESLLSNERLEFVGDSLVNLMVAKELYTRFADHNEGDLSKIRGALVNESKLAELARSLELGDYLFLGKGECKTGGQDKDSILSDAFEALICAIYYDCDSDLVTLEKIFNSIIISYEKDSKSQSSESFYSLNVLDSYDPKSKLQELTMARYGSLPVYKSQEISAKEGFNVEVWIEGKKIKEATGISKKKIEKTLAREIIDHKLY